MTRYENILDLIGNTPMVDISALSPNPRVAIVTKLEGWNPGGSVKDHAGQRRNMRRPDSVSRSAPRAHLPAATMAFCFRRPDKCAVPTRTSALEVRSIKHQRPRRGTRQAT